MSSYVHYGSNLPLRYIYSTRSSFRLSLKITGSS